LTGFDKNDAFSGLRSAGGCTCILQRYTAAMTQNTDFLLTEFLPYLLNRAAEDSSVEFAKIYKDQHGLLRTDWRILFHLGQFGGMTATEIGQRSKIHKTKISRSVAALQKRRLLARTRNETDRRSEQLCLTLAGEKMFEELSNTANRYNAALLEKIPLEDRALFLRCLERLIA